MRHPVIVSLREEVDLEPLDPGTGRSLPRRTDAAPAAPAGSALRWRWLFAIVFVVGSLVSGYVIVNHRAAETLSTSWAQAAVERSQLSVTTESMRRMSTFLDVSDDDVAEIRRARSEAVKEARLRLRADRHDIARAVPLDPKARALRQRMLDHVDRWIAELDEFVARDRQWVRTAPTQQLDQPVAAMVKRWRVARHEAATPSPFASATRVINRLSRPTDVPVPLRFTGFTARGNRIDVDLRAGVVTTTSLGSIGLAGDGGPASARVFGGRLLVDTRSGDGRLVLLPLQASAEATALDVRGFLPPTPSQAPWVVTGDHLSMAAVVGGGAAIAIPLGYAVQGSSSSFLVLTRPYEEHAVDASVRTTLLDLASRRLIDLPEPDVFLGSWGDTSLWARPGALVVRNGFAVTRTVRLPDGGVPTHASIDADGTIVMTVERSPAEASVSSGGSTIVAAGPNDDVGHVVAAPDTLVWHMEVANGWALYVSGASFTRSQVRVVELATGRELTVRLQDPFLTALTVH